MVCTVHKIEDHDVSFYYFMANTWRNNENSDKLYFLGSKITGDSDCGCEKEMLILGR